MAKGGAPAPPSPTSVICLHVHKSLDSATLLRCSLSAATAEHLVDRRFEMACPSGRGHLGTQDSLIGNLFPVVFARVGGVLVNFVTSKINSREQALAPRVGQKLGVRKLRGRRLRVSAHRTGSRSNVAAELHLVLQQIVQTSIVDPDQYQV